MDEKKGGKKEPLLPFTEKCLLYNTSLSMATKGHFSTKILQYLFIFWRGSARDDEILNKQKLATEPQRRTQT